MSIRLQVHYGKDPAGFYWPDSEQKRREILAIRQGAPAIFEATYQGRPGQREGSIFMENDFSYYEAPPSLQAGRLSVAVTAFIKNGHCVLQAWDTAMSTSNQSARSVCVTGMLVACDQYHRGEDPRYLGPCEHHYDVYILDVFRDRLRIQDLINKVKVQYGMWAPELVLVEDRSTGIPLIQMFESSGIPIEGVSTGNKSKSARALNTVDARGSLSVQGHFQQHRVRFPSEATWLASYKAELKDFSGEDDAASDQVDATVYLVTKAILMGASGALLPTGWSPDRPGDIGEEDVPNNSSDAQFLTWLGGLGDSEDIFGSTCGRCAAFVKDTRWCRVHKRPSIALDSCEFWRAA